MEKVIPDIIWHLFRVESGNEEEIKKNVEVFQERFKAMPNRAKVSTRCPKTLEAQIKNTLEELGITLEHTTYALPNDLWLANDQKHVQSSFLPVLEGKNNNGGKSKHRARSTRTEQQEAEPE